MSELKVIIEKNGLTRDEAEDLLYKALSVSREGKTHSGEFDDPAMQSIIDLMQTLHKKVIDDILKETMAVLKEDLEVMGGSNGNE